MTDKAKGIIEAIKQGFDIYEAMAMPIQKQTIELTRDSALTLVAELEQITRERDALLEEIKGDCGRCVHCMDEWNKALVSKAISSNDIKAGYKDCRKYEVSDEQNT